MTKIFYTGVAVAVIFSIQNSTAFAENTAPSAEQIIQKAVEKSTQPDVKKSKPDYTFTTVTETQKLDTKGNLKEHKKSLYEMFFRSGFLSKKRVISPGETLAETKKKESQENNDPLKLAKFQPENRGDFINILSPQLIGKYVFTLVDQATINGRSAYEIAFRPKQNNLPGKELAERVLNQAAGKLWIDAEEFEVAKADVHVDSEICVGGGLLGSLKKAVFMLERTRLPGGIWFERSMKTDYEARKLAESTRVITISESSNFKKLSSEG